MGLESAEPGWILPAVEALRGKAFRVRSIGAIAITLAYVAAGRLDGMLTARVCRSVDAAGGQLIARGQGAGGSRTSTWPTPRWTSTRDTGSRPASTPTCSR